MEAGGGGKDADEEPKKSDNEGCLVLFGLRLFIIAIHLYADKGDVLSTQADRQIGRETGR